MGNLTTHFDRDEFACGCGCGFNTVDYELLVHLEYLRAHADNWVVINSCCRCVTHNRKEGGGLNSQHLVGRAADIVVKGMSPQQVYHYFNSRWPGRYGLGIYLTDKFVHFDTRSARARWIDEKDKGQFQL